MKLFIQTSGMTSATRPSWVNIFWPHYTAYSESVPTVLLETPYWERPPGKFANRRMLWQERRSQSRRLVEEVRSQLDPNGPNILIAWVLTGNDLIRTTYLDEIWSLFDYRVLTILDTIEVEYVDLSMVRRFDLITSVCGDLGKTYSDVSGVPEIYFPPHTDVLNFHNASAYRPVDMLVIGRRNRDIHDPIHRHFNTPGSDRFSLDFVTRTRSFTPSSLEEESNILLNGYSRAKISFCFEPSPWPRFRGRSLLSERWTHSWTSGCTVMGSAPFGRGVAEQIDWPEATIELPDSPDDAIAMIEDVLADETALVERRHRNIAEAARRHDSRHRLRLLFETLDVKPPETLAQGLARLDALGHEMDGRAGAARTR